MGYTGVTSSEGTGLGIYTAYFGWGVRTWDTPGLLWMRGQSMEYIWVRGQDLEYTRVILGEGTRLAIHQGYFV